MSVFIPNHYPVQCDNDTITIPLASSYGTNVQADAGTDGQGVLKSTDGGESWTAINSGLANLSIRALAIDPFNPTTIYAGIDAVYSYDDLGSDSPDFSDSSDSSDSSDFF